MTFQKAIDSCHVRSSITYPGGSLYGKNHSVSFYLRVPQSEQSRLDWEECDPRDYDLSSLFMYND